MNTTIGIDGCKGGWLAVSMTSLKFQRITLLEKIEEIANLISLPDSIWIDMPIGLSEGDVHRDLEQYARPFLRPYRSSSLFTPPCREAVYQPDYQSAKDTNLNQCGKSISIQSWNISPKIRELDSWLLGDASRQRSLYEAHPEICFAALNDMNPLAESKQTELGRDQRLSLLIKHVPDAKAFYHEALRQFLRKQAKPDDILDAMCLALCATLSLQHGIQLIQGETRQDNKGLFIRMAYPNIL